MYNRWTTFAFELQVCEITIIKHQVFDSLREPARAASEPPIDRVHHSTALLYN